MPRKVFSYVVALVLVLALSLATLAIVGADSKMGNVDRSGSRSLARNAQGDLSKANVAEHGLRVRWTVGTSGSVAGAAAVSNGTAFVGDMDGYVYANFIPINIFMN